MVYVYTCTSVHFWSEAVDFGQAFIFQLTKILMQTPVYNYLLDNSFVSNFSDCGNSWLRTEANACNMYSMPQKTTVDNAPVHKVRSVAVTQPGPSLQRRVEAVKTVE